MSRVLAVDIGNSNIVIGSFERSDYTELGRLKSDRNLSEDEISEGFADLIHKAGLKKNLLTARFYQALFLR